MRGVKAYSLWKAFNVMVSKRVKKVRKIFDNVHVKSVKKFCELDNFRECSS